jgi:hypothetical protein
MVFLNRADARVIAAQVLMLATQPHVRECALVVYGQPSPAGGGRRVIWVQDESLIELSAALVQRPFAYLSKACAVVQLGPKPLESEVTGLNVAGPGAAKPKLPESGGQSTSLEELRKANVQLDQLYGERGEQDEGEIEAKIAELEERAAAIVRARGAAQLGPVQRHFDDAMQAARALLQKK